MPKQRTADEVLLGYAPEIRAVKAVVAERVAAVPAQGDPAAFRAVAQACRTAAATYHRVWQDAPPSIIATVLMDARGYHEQLAKRWERSAEDFERRVAGAR